MSPSTFAAMIAGIESHGVSRPQIVEISGLSKNTVWRMAAGEVRLPSYETVRRLEYVHRRVIEGAPLPAIQRDVKHGRY